jgi:dienelactone hydrolase
MPAATGRSPRSRTALVVAALGALAPGSLVAQRPAPRPWPGLEPGPHAVGYTVRHEYDYSRTFRAKTDYFGERTTGEIARPIQITMWYPAAADPRAPRMRVSEYYEAVATETDFAAPTPDQLRALLESRRQMLLMEWRVPPDARQAAGRGVDSVLAEPAAAVRDAPPAPGAFPLILHMPGYDGSPADHYPLFEYLASHGFVVAAVPSLGRSSRNIDDERVSLDVQARDLEYAYSVVRTLPFVDAGRVGTTGMSWGGMSNVLFASRNAYVDAVVTLDGAITMPEELKLIESVPGYTHRSFRAAYLQLLVSPEEATFRPKDLRFWNALRYSEAWSVQFNGVSHDDFSPGYRRLHDITETDPRRVAYLEAFARAELEYTRRFFDAALKADESARSSLAVLVRRMGLPDSMVAAVESKRALKAPPSAEEFAAILRSRGARVAAAVFHQSRDVDPEIRLVTSPIVGPVFMEALNARRFAEALAICELWAEGMPHDAGPLFSMARTYRAMGDKERAIRTCERILAMVPEGRQAETARRAIAELRR